MMVKYLSNMVSPFREFVGTCKLRNEQYKNKKRKQKKKTKKKIMILLIC